MKTIKEKILDMIIKAGGGISFVNLEKINGFSGNRDLYDDKTSILYWQKVSKAALKAINELLKEEKIEMKSTSFSYMAYMIDGKLIALPVAKGLRKYKALHWLPTCFYIGEAA